MTDPKDWKEQSQQAITVLSTATSSSTATDLPEVAKASSGVTYIIVNNFHFAPSPEAVPDHKFEELRTMVKALESKIEMVPSAKTHAQKCKEEYERNWQQAHTKPEKFYCLTTYATCLAHGFNMSISISW